MTKRMTLAQLAATSLALPLTGLAKQQFMYAIADDYLSKATKHFDFGQAYVHPYYIEDTGIERVRAISTTGTALEPAVNALNAAGIKTVPTLGGMMDTLGLGQADMHELICHCKGAVQNGHAMAARFNKVGDKFGMSAAA